MNANIKNLFGDNRKCLYSFPSILNYMQSLHNNVICGDVLYKEQNTIFVQNKEEIISHK